MAETSYRPFGKKGPLTRLIVRRVRPTPGSQLALFTTYDYHPFITDRAGSTLELEADHRRHAEVEPAICDLKHGAGLQHLPSGRFAANAAWLGLVGIAYNLAQWTTRLGVGEPRLTLRPCGSATWRCPAGFRSRPADPPCTCPPAGHGSGGGSSPWPGCAASPTPPDDPTPAVPAFPSARPGRAAACPDTTETATTTPTEAGVRPDCPARRLPQPIPGPSRRPRRARLPLTINSSVESGLIGGR